MDIAIISGGVVLLWCMSLLMAFLIGTAIAKEDGE
jgi:hypothetical protein